MKAREIDLKLELWPRQLQALKTKATELLFGGATEGGKSHLVRVALITWCLMIPGLQCVLIRKKYDDILKNHVDGPTGFRAMLAPLIEAGQVTLTQKQIRFPGGSCIDFVHCQDERQFDSAQGVEKHVLVLDEATQISERLIRFFRTWVRMPGEFKKTIPEEWRDAFPRIIYTANPIGASVPFFRRQFVFARPAFQIERVEGFLRQYIPSRYTDNLSVDEEAHKGRLEGIGDAQLAKALDEGDWNALVGDFFPEWDEERHVVADFQPPSHWFKYRTFDWGGAEPFAVYWIAVSDGERFIDEMGRKRWFPPGALVYYREWYGCNPEKPAEGIRMRNEDIAEGILNRTRENTSGLTISDNLPFQDRGMSKNSAVYKISDVFFEAGCPLTLGNTARKHGWSQVRDRLIGVEYADDWRVPMIFFTESCVYARDYLPAIGRKPNDPEDAVEDGEETHSPDAIRLGCTARPFVKKKMIRSKTLSKSNTITPELALKQIQKKKKRGSRIFD